MKILITGYKGFIGRNMMKFFEPKHEVIGYDFNDGPYNLDGVNWVIHLGAVSSTTTTDTRDLLIKNYYFTKKFVSDCTDKRIPMQIASTAAIYGTDNKTFNVFDTPAPKNHYAWSKLLVEQYATTRAWAVPVQFFRYFNVYGDGEDHKGDQASPYYKFTKQAKETGTIKLFEGSENYYRDFIHVDEICRYHERFFGVPESGIWNLGTGTCKSFKDVALEIQKQYNCNIEYVPMPENLKQSYQTLTKADMSLTDYVLKGYKR